jgi:hypothetical protein
MTVGRLSHFRTGNQWVKVGYMNALDRWFSKIIEPVLTLNWGSKKVKELGHRTYPEPTSSVPLYFHEFVSLKIFKYPE